MSDQLGNDGGQLGPDRQFRVLIDHSPDAVVVHVGRALVFANPAALRLIGATEPTQVVGHPMTEFVHMGSTAALFERIAMLDGLGAASVPTSMVLRRLDGVSVEVESRSVLTLWEARPAYLVVLRDMSAQRAAEAATAMSERQFTTVVEHLVEGVVVLDGAGVVHSINPAACTILVCTPATSSRRPATGPSPTSWTPPQRRGPAG